MHSVALKSDQTVYVWGSNISGQIGNGTTTHTNIPTIVSGVSGVSEIASGGRHVLAKKSDGTLWAWGMNYAGQLGDGTNSPTGCGCKMLPQQVLNLCALSTGIMSEETSEVMSVYPNPSNGEIKISTGDNEEYSLAVFNSLGQVVYMEKLIGETSDVNLSQLEEGVYMLRLMNASGLAAQKKIIIKK
jgi:alpha-tubulin suppressor-like RCC1 family protein